MYPPNSIDLQNFMLRSDDQPPRRTKLRRRFQPQGRFLAGPIGWDWLTAAARLPGKALHVALVIQFQWRLNKSRPFSLSSQEVRSLGMHRSTASRALAALASAGLVTVVRHRGRSPMVTVCEQGLGPADAVTPICAARQCSPSTKRQHFQKLQKTNTNANENIKV